MTQARKTSRPISKAARLEAQNAAQLAIRIENAGRWIAWAPTDMIESSRAPRRPAS